MPHFDPSDISNWADLPDANHQLPELIRRLILATVPQLSRLDIPSGSAVWQEGWDGLLTATTGNAWVPDCASAWEFGCENRATSKANKDYRKRTDDPQEDVEIASATFVFVTPRKWRDKKKWVRQRQVEGKWADVRAFDASDLATWLEQAPAVATWFARLTGKLPADGYTTLGEWWENWSTVSRPNISPALVLAGRPESADKVAEVAQQTPTHYYVQGQTREEAIAFVAASALNSGDAWGATLLSKALVVKSEDAWNSLVTHALPLVLIRAFGGNVSPQVATNRGHHVITPLHASDDTMGDGIALPRLGRDETITALTEMDLSEIRARALARKTVRSLPIIRRFLIDEAGGPMPGWASVDAQNPLPALILIGQWDEDSEHDRAVVAQVTGHHYEEVVRELALLAQAEDSPLTKIGSRWRFLSHEEAWHLLAPRLTSTDIDRFQEAATAILKAESPEFEMPIGERYLANIHDKVVSHSGVLRAGIARALALMGSQGDRARNVEGASYLPERILRSVLADNEAWQIWATLDRHLATLAEAAPEAILSAIEESLIATQSTFGDLFAQEGDPLFGGSSHTGLIWALERLAWSPDYFARVATVLARLALIDPGGRVSNRPAESLTMMFLPWLRVSECSDADRLETLETLLNRQPVQGWKIVVNAYPTGFATAVRREPPSWRPWAQDGATTPNRGDFDAFVDGMEQLLLEHVGDDVARWVDTVGIISSLTPGARARASELLAQRAGAIREHPDSVAIWTALREKLNRHRGFPDAEWAMPAVDLEPLAAVYQQLTPDDPVAAYGWLFDGWPHPPEGTEHSDIEGHFAKIDTDRQSAIAAAYESGGIEAILSIAKSAQQPEEVGRAFTIGIGTDPALALAVKYAGSDDGSLRMMARGVLWAVFRQSGWVMLDDAIARLKADEAQPQALAVVFLAAPAVQDTWRRLAEETPEVQRCYWELLNPWQAPRDGETEVDFVAEQLLTVRRSPTVSEWAAHMPVDYEIAIRTLEQLPVDLAAVVEPESVPNGFIYDIVRLFEKLDESDAVGDDIIARLEWQLASALPHFVSALLNGGRANLSLYREITREPALFADLVALSYRRSDGQSEAAPDEQAAQVSTEILTQIIFGEGEVPGKTKDGTVDYEMLSAWVNEARRLCSERGRAGICDNFIGYLLAKAPAGADSVRPCEAVRDLLDSIGSLSVGDGFMAGTHNLRGITTRGAFEGGHQERTLADEYREQAAMIASKWPYTASLLRRVADSYQHEARRNDREADEIDQFGF